MKRILVAALLALAAGTARAQWEVTTENVPEMNHPVAVARVTNDSAHSLRIYRNEAGVVRGIFTIRDGFDELAAGSCPTYRIDENRPVSVTLGDDWCRLEPRRALFSLGRVEGGRIRSDALLELMNGTRILFRYHLDSVGYRETEFTLLHSKQALTEIIGYDVVVVGE